MTGTSYGTALITGAGSGIGRATAARLRTDGWNVVLLDRDHEGLERTRDLLGGAADTVAVDVTDRRAVDSAIIRLLGRTDVDLLVNNAGIGVRATALDTTDEDWDRTVEVNLTAMFRLCRHVLPGMIARGHGIVVNVASAGGLVGLRYRAAYCASKAGVIGLTRALAADHIGQGIRINAIAPGTVDTEWIGRILDGDPDPVATRRTMELRQLDGRMGTPEEVAYGISFLASPQARFVNGSVFSMDAGLTAV